MTDESTDLEPTKQDMGADDYWQRLARSEAEVERLREALRTAAENAHYRASIAERPSEPVPPFDTCPQSMCVVARTALDSTDESAEAQRPCGCPADYHLADCPILTDTGPPDPPEGGW